MNEKLKHGMPVIQCIEQMIGTSNLNKRQILLLFAYLIAVIIGMTIIHEAGHFVAALALGVPLSQIKIELIGGNPGVTISNSVVSGSLTIMHYAGGFSAAFILIVLYFVLWSRKYHASSSLFLWFLGFITMGFSGLQIGYAIAEGLFHAAYVRYANSPTAASNIIIGLFGVLGLTVHFQFCRLSKLKKKGSL